MADFDYGNARLHAMKSLLLSRQTLAELTGSGSVRGLINALTKTPYREAVEMALVQFSDMDALNRARRDNLVDQIHKAHHFYRGTAAELAGWVVARYDVDNVKAVLRGLQQQVPANEILDGVLPAGQLQPTDLAQLIRAANPRAAIDLLATWRLPLARPLMYLRQERPGADLFEMELALERWYYRAALAAAEEHGAVALQKYLRVGADITNMLTAFRLVGLPESTPFLRQHFHTDDPSPLFVGPGILSLPLLVEAAGQNSIRRAVQKLGDTPYATALAAGLQQYNQQQRLSELEHTLRRYQLRQARLLLISDPLGIGVMIGYMALNTTESRNVHRIALGLAHQEAPERVLAELIFEA
jgi:vacuolar-type H+-ATPase subunit C/Vma6